MYFLTALICSVISGLLFFFYKDRKKLHLEILTIIFSAATLMWFVDCVASAIGGEGFITFDDTKDGYIALWTIIGGLFLWQLISFILNNGKKSE